MASISSSSSATVRVEKATSEFLIGPDWALNIDICDNLNANRMLAKDVLKAVKKRMQHKNPNVIILALTLLETMVKNCGDYIHVQIAERNILQEMVKIVKKKHDLRLRDKIVTLIGSWHDAFGGIGGKYPQYYMAYEDLRRLGIDFPRRPPEPAELYSPPPQPVTEPIARQTPPPAYPMSRQYPQPGYPIVAGIPQPSYGMPSTSSTRLDEAMAAEGNLSFSSMNAMRDVLDLLNDMLQAVDPSDRMAVKDEVIVDLVEQCRANQRKLIQLLGTTGDDELLGVGLDLNDCLQIALAKHDAIASGSPLPPEVASIKTGGASEKQDSSPKSAGVGKPNAMSNDNNTPSAPSVPPQKGQMEEDEEEEEDEFALLARRHSTPRANASLNTPTVQSDVASSEAPSSPTNALVPFSPPPPALTKDQDIIDLLSITLATPTSTEPTSQVPTSPMQTPNHIPSTSQPEAFPSHPGLGFNSYIAPWAQAQSQPQSPFQAQTASQNLSPSQPQPGVGPRPERDPPSQQEYQYATTQEPSFRASESQPETPQYTAYPPPPWAATPGYLTNQSPAFRQPYTYSHEPINGEAQVSSNLRSPAGNGGQKPFIPSYRLFEDLNVLGNSDRRFKAATGNGSPSFSGSNNQSMIGGRKL